MERLVKISARASSSIEKGRLPTNTVLYSISIIDMNVCGGAYLALLSGEFEFRLSGLPCLLLPLGLLSSFGSGTLGLFTSINPSLGRLGLSGPGLSLGLGSGLSALGLSLSLLLSLSRLSSSLLISSYLVRDQSRPTGALFFFGLEAPSSPITPPSSRIFWFCSACRVALAAARRSWLAFLLSATSSLDLANSSLTVRSPNAACQSTIRIRAVIDALFSFSWSTAFWADSAEA